MFSPDGETIDIQYLCMCRIYVCVQVFMCRHMYILKNKYAMAEYVCTCCVFLAVICEHESVNMIDYIYMILCF